MVTFLPYLAPERLDRPHPVVRIGTTARRQVIGTDGPLSLRQDRKGERSITAKPTGNRAAENRGTGQTSGPVNDGRGGENRTSLSIKDRSIFRCR